MLIPCFRFITPHDKEHLSHAYGDFWFWGWKKKDVYPLGEIEFEGRTYPETGKVQQSCLFRRYYQRGLCLQWKPHG